mgnify:CR=1 FL=1
MPVTAVKAAKAGVRRAVVIGASGFIGYNLSTLLTGLRIDTACFTRETRFLQRDGLDCLLRTADFIFYLASSINPTLAEQHPEWAQADHALFAELVSRLARTGRPPTVVLASSGTVYDPDVSPPYSELSPTRATEGYGAAKLALEQELVRHSAAVPGVILRISTVYGPGQRAASGQGVLAHWRKAAREGRPLRVIGNPGSTRDYIYIDDVIDCMYRIFLAEGQELFSEWGNPLVLNVASGVPTSLAALADTVREVVDPGLAFEYVPARPFDRVHIWADIERARHALGWQPRMRIPEGIRAMWACEPRPDPGKRV